MGNPHFQAMLIALSPLDEPIRRKKAKNLMESVYERPDYKKRNKRLARAMKRAGDES